MAPRCRVAVAGEQFGSVGVVEKRVAESQDGTRGDDPPRLTVVTSSGSAPLAVTTAGRAMAIASATEMQNDSVKVVVWCQGEVT